MPLHGKDPFELIKTRPKPGIEYLIIRFTKEHFKRYKDYIERLELYLQRVWTCSITGKQGLTFEEALVSEKTAAEKQTRVSEILIPRVIELIQYKESTLEDVTNSTYEFLLQTYFPGEIVVFKTSTGSKHTGRIIGEDEIKEEEEEPIVEDKPPKTTMKSKYSDDEEEEEEEEEEKPIAATTTKKTTTTTTNTTATSGGGSGPGKGNFVHPRKKLQDIKKGYKIYVDSQSKNYVVPVSAIMRRDPPVFKPVVKDTIKSIAKRSKHLGGWWEVDQELLGKYKLTILAPSHLRREIESLKRKRDDDGTNTGNDYDIDYTDEENSDSEQQQKPKVIKYPIEDLDIDRSSDIQMPDISNNDEDTEENGTTTSIATGVGKKPIASSDFFCTPSLYGEFLMAWHFLNQFERVLSLSPFTLDDLEQAISYNGETDLIIETHIRLLRNVFTTQAYTHGTPKKSFSGKNLNEKNWYQILIQYFQYETKRLKIEEQYKLEKLKELEAKNIKMLNLANELPTNGEDQDDDESTSTTKNGIKKEGEEEGAEVKQEGEEEKGEEEEEEDLIDSSDEEEGEEDEQVDLEITSSTPELILKVLKKKNYFRLSVDEKVHVLSYLCLHSITTDKVRKYLDEMTEVATELKSEKRGIIAEERKIKKEEEEEEKENNKNNNNKNKKAKTNVELDKLVKKEENLDQRLIRYNTRLECIGKDRDFNKYWYWPQLPGRLYVELSNESGEWEYYSSKTEIDELMSYLDNRGIRERKLLASLNQKYDNITQALELKNQQILQQITYESKRSSRLKSVKPFMQWENSYQ